jgi:prepilin-type N-terminal cleavage/methylation domain-containing protein
MRKLVRTLRKAFRYGEAGFTLIELLVVIGILAALAGVVTLAVTQFIGRGNNEANCTELHNIQTAAAAVIVDGGTPTTQDDLTDYLLTAPRCTYTIGSFGQVVTQTCPNDGTTMCAQ